MTRQGLNRPMWVVVLAVLALVGCSANTPAATSVATTTSTAAATTTATTAAATTTAAAPTTTAASTSSAATTTTAPKGSSQKGEVAPSLPGAPQPVTSISGPLTIGLDFKPEADGFGFQNYGNDQGYVNLTPEDVVRFFGDQVCGSNADGKCTLTPPAQQWMDAANDGMKGGHCEGMATLALLIKKGLAKASDFGADLTFALKPDGNDKLTREIAYWFQTQGLAPTAPELATLKPSEVVAKLRDSFQPGAAESYTLGIYKTIDGQKSEGHAITPFGLVDRPDGQTEIAIYDNNFPGESRAVVVDPAAETWTYSTAANPADQVSLYEGNATTFSLTLTPTSARVQPQVCPFCAAAASGGGSGGILGPHFQATADDTGQLYLDSAGDDAGVVLRVTAPDGSALPGLTELHVKGEGFAQDDEPPVLLIPSGQAFNVVIDGSNADGEATTSVTFVDNGIDYYLDGINVSPGQVDEARFDPATGSVTYTTRKSEAPTIGAGFSAPGADYDFAIGGVDLPDGGTVSIVLDQANGTFTIKNQDESQGTYSLGMDRIADDGEQSFADPGFDLPSKASVSLDFKAWSSKNDKLKVSVDLGDGQAPTESELQSS